MLHLAGEREDVGDARAHHALIHGLHRPPDRERA